MGRDGAIARASLPDLGGGLGLRRATREDAEALATFNGDLHHWPEPAGPNPGMAAWTRDLLRGDHPTVAPGDFTVVEDTRRGAIVSTLCLISQTWSYDGIPFGVGQPELVGTHPDYRRRGLVRAQFAWIHRWSAERGQLVQGITGIPWYYRQFGYEHGGLALGAGRTGYLPHVPELKDGQPEPYRLRPATEADIPLLRELAARQAARSLVACVRDEALWRYELTGRDEGSDEWHAWRIVETAASEPGSASCSAPSTRSTRPSPTGCRARCRRTPGTCACPTCRASSARSRRRWSGGWRNRRWRGTAAGLNSPS